MKRIRIGHRRQLFEILGKSQRLDLQTGRGWFGDEWGPHGSRGGELWNANRQRAWEMHRDALIEAWLAEHPGTRPAAFWAFDAADRRESETETAYLTRHKLLTVSERASLEQSERGDTLRKGDPDHGEK